MKLSSKSRYAVKSMLQLALLNEDETLPLTSITEAQGLSQSYLEQLFAALRAKELIHGMRGPGGGYRIARAPDQVSVAEIIAAVDESAFTRPQRPMLSYLDDERYKFNAMWADLSNMWFEFLDKISLQELIDNRTHYQSLLSEKAA